MSDKFEHRDPLEVILRTAGGVFFAVCDAVDAETSARAIKAMRAYADNSDCQHRRPVPRPGRRARV